MQLQQQTIATAMLCFAADQGYLTLERIHYIGKLYNKSSEVLNSATDPRLHGVTNLQSC